jgi:ABC-type glycerol-3-phosphate transport system permease component
MSSRAASLSVGRRRAHKGDRYYVWSRRLASFWLHLLVLASLVILLLPIAWMISTSLKPLEDVFQYPPRWIPDRVTFAGYVAQANPLLGRYFLNSVIVGLGSALLATFAGALAGYGLARFRFTGNSLILMLFMASLAFPIPLLMISMYMLFVEVSLLDSYWALILGHTAITLPVAVWLLKNFFDQLPIEVEEAAYVDGAGPVYTLFHIVLPMARPALAASAIFVFVTSWNELLFGLAFTSSTAMRPLPAGISMSFLTEFEGAWPEMMALAVIVSLPIFLLFVFFQRLFMQGVTAGAVKG